jgi:hypothetical protein
LSFFKKGEQKDDTAHVWEIGTRGRSEDIRKGCRKVNTLKILCSHVWKWKNETG